MNAVALPRFEINNVKSRRANLRRKRRLPLAHQLYLLGEKPICPHAIKAHKEKVIHDYFNPPDGTPPPPPHTQAVWMSVAPITFTDDIKGIIPDEVQALMNELEMRLPSTNRTQLSLQIEYFLADPILTAYYTVVETTSGQLRVKSHEKYHLRCWDPSHILVVNHP